MSNNLKKIGSISLAFTLSVLGIQLFSQRTNAQPSTDPGSYYSLKNDFTGSGKCVDIINDGANNKLNMTDCASVTGQFWNFSVLKLSGGEVLQLRNQFSGPGKCLDIVNDGANNKLIMANCGNFTGQFWNFRNSRLTNNFSGAGKCLDIVNDGTNNKLVMANCGNFTGQKWQYTTPQSSARPVSQVPKSNSQKQGPAYIIAHRCNGIDYVKNAAQKQGVNAIEADFAYGRPTVFTKKRWYLAHDGVNVGSETLDDWLKSVSKEASRTGTPLALLHVDIKNPEGPLPELFDTLRAKLPNVHLIFDIGLVKAGKYLAPIKSRILNDSKAVAAMGFDDSPTSVNAFFQREGYPLNKYWYEIGLAAGFTWSKKEEDWTKEAIRLRNAGQGPKIVIWTFEKESSVKDWLNQGVDGILVNSSSCFGRTTKIATDADVHVRNAKNLPNGYATPADNAFP
jgi:Ricin-type beta-trefoil lectin domain